MAARPQAPLGAPALLGAVRAALRAVGQRRGRSTVHRVLHDTTLHPPGPFRAAWKVGVAAAGSAPSAQMELEVDRALNARIRPRGLRRPELDLGRGRRADRRHRVRLAGRCGGRARADGRVVRRCVLRGQLRQWWARSGQHPVPRGWGRTPHSEPLIAVSETSDPDGDTLVYIIEVDTVSTFDGADFNSTVVPASLSTP